MAQKSALSISDTSEALRALWLALSSVAALNNKSNQVKEKNDLPFLESLLTL